MVSKFTIRPIAARWPALALASLAVLGIVITAPAFAADSIEGQVLGGGAPIAKSTVTLWSASADAPRQLAQTQTGDDGHFTLTPEGSSGEDGILYLVAKGGVPTAHQGSGDNPAIGLIAVLGDKPPAKVDDQRVHDRGVSMD